MEWSPLVAPTLSSLEEICTHVIPELHFLRWHAHAGLLYVQLCLDFFYSSCGKVAVWVVRLLVHHLVHTSPTRVQQYLVPSRTRYILQIRVGKGRNPPLDFYTSALFTVGTRDKLIMESDR